MRSQKFTRFRVMLELKNGTEVAAEKIDAFDAVQAVRAVNAELKQMGVAVRPQDVVSVWVEDLDRQCVALTIGHDTNRVPHKQHARKDD